MVEQYCISPNFLSHIGLMLFNFSTFIINTVPTPIFKHKSPYQILDDKLPDSDSFKIFGSLCYASTLQVHRTKLDPKVRKCIFPGYKHVIIDYDLLDFHTIEVFVSRNVIFITHSPLQILNTIFIYLVKLFSIHNW